MNKTIRKCISLLLVCMMLFGVMSSISYAANEANSITFNVKKVSETKDTLILDVELVSGSFVCAELTASTSDRLSCTEINMCDNFIEFQQENGGITSETNLLTQKVAIISLTSYSEEGSLVRYSFSKNEVFGAVKDDVTFTVSCCYDNVNGQDVELQATVTSDLSENHTHISDGIWVTTKESTCQSEGTKATHCTICGEEAEQSSIEKAEHQTVTNTVDATCTKDGYIQVVCKNCQTVISTQTLSATGHQHKRTVTKAPTCTVNGYEKEICMDCGAVLSNTPIVATGHQHTKNDDKDATCTEKGYHKVICVDCGATVSETEIFATGHQHVHNEVKDPTCTEDGYFRVICDDCSTIVSEEKLSAKHLPIQKKVSPTCTEDGYVETICSSCGISLSNRVTLKSEGHKWSDWETVKEPTYKSNGLRVRHCQVCSEPEEEIIPMIAVEPTGISISMTDITMNYKKSTRLYANVMPEEAAYSTEIVWSSSNPNVATVDEDGNVYAAKVGTAIITASTEDGSYSAECKVTVEYSFLQIIIIYVLFGWIWY